MNEKDYNFVLSEVKYLRGDGDSFHFTLPETARGKTAIFVEVFDNAYRIEANDLIDGALVPIESISTSGAEFGDYAKFMDEFSQMHSKLMHTCYYDVVLSIYEENNNGEDRRVDSHLIRGGFETDYEAEMYILDKEGELSSEGLLAEKYRQEHSAYVEDRYYAQMEIEEHSLEGSCTKVVTID